MERLHPMLKKGNFIGVYNNEDYGSPLMNLMEGGDTGSGRWEIGGKKMWEVGDWG